MAVGIVTCPPLAVGCLALSFAANYSRAKIARAEALEREKSRKR